MSGGRTDLDSSGQESTGGFDGPRVGSTAPRGSSKSGSSAEITSKPAARGQSQPAPPPGRSGSAVRTRRVSAAELRRRKVSAGAPRIAMLTAYDHALARLVDDAGLDALLVGDSLGMVVRGEDDTLGVSLDDMVYHTRQVARAAQRALVVADLPFMSFQISAEQALTSAGRLVSEGRAGAVKLEGAGPVAESARRIVMAGIPVLGHLGMTPQSVHAFGGFVVQGRSSSAADRLVGDALELERAGVFGVVLEAIPQALAQRVTEALTIPTIGIGAGVGCDGQVLVLHDVLGLLPDFKPRFARRYADLGRQVQAAARAFVADVRAGDFPSREESFGRPPALEGSADAGAPGASKGASAADGSQKANNAARDNEGDDAGDDAGSLRSAGTSDGGAVDTSVISSSEPGGERS